METMTTVVDDQLTRVRSVIGGLVKEFCTDRVGEKFHLTDLETFCSDRVRCTPGSASRVLRDLRQRGEVNYTVVDRYSSTYVVLGVFE